jgi:hypothetical protein
MGRWQCLSCRNMTIELHAPYQLQTNRRVFFTCKITLIWLCYCKSVFTIRSDRMAGFVTTAKKNKFHVRKMFIIYVGVLKIKSPYCDLDMNGEIDQGRQFSRYFLFIITPQMISSFRPIKSWKLFC